MLSSIESIPVIIAYQEASATKTAKTIVTSPLVIVKFFLTIESGTAGNSNAGQSGELLSVATDPQVQ